MKCSDVMTNNEFSVQLPDLLHGERVGDLALELAIYAEVEVDKAKLLKASIFHDIGKSMLDKKILNKTSSLTSEEYEHVKKHSKYGALILRSAGIDNEVKEIVLNHHERHDGSGYPNGKDGDEIPIEAQVIAICDDYDALISKRPYRDGYSTKKTLKIISSQQVKYNPYLHKKFMEMMCKSVLDPQMDVIFINKILENIEEEKLLEGTG